MRTTAFLVWLVAMALVAVGGCTSKPPPPSPATAPGSGRGPSIRTTEWETYQGSSFAVKYPKGFSAKGVEPDKETPTLFDGAVFVPEDHSVEFYAFLSINGRDCPSHWAQLKPGERYASRLTASDGQRQSISAIVIGPSHSFQRSYTEVIDTKANTRRVVGIKYGGPDAYKKYKVLYAEFGASLRLIQQPPTPPKPTASRTN